MRAFEVQVYDAQTAPRGGDQHVIDGRRGETRMTFEPHAELTAWAELGGDLLHGDLAGHLQLEPGAKLAVSLDGAVRVGAEGDAARSAR